MPFGRTANRQNSLYLHFLNDDTVIETDRLILRPWVIDDADALYRYASDRRVSELALWPRHTSIEMSRMVIREFFMTNPLSFEIVLKETSEPVGCIGLVPKGEEHYRPLSGEREVGYWIGCPYWNKGLTSEALRALMTYCGKTLGIKSFMITADGTNIASRRVAEKCGFRFVADFDFDGIPSRLFRLKID